MEGEPGIALKRKIEPQRAQRYAEKSCFMICA